MQIYKYILILILIYSCDNPTSSNIPIDVPGDFTNYQTNLYSLNSGQYLDQITINWNTYTEGSFLQYSIHGQDNEILESIEDVNESIYTITSNSAQYQKIFLYVESEFETIQDSIIVFTRDVYPITNFSAIANVDDWSTQLEWTPSAETDSIFTNYKIYRLDNLNYDQFSDLESCNCEIATLDDRLISSYIDSGDFNLGEEFFYIVETNTTQGYSRKSIIKSNLSSINYTCSPMLMDNPSPGASQSEYNKITLNWSHNLNQSQFYELQIWRSSSENINPLSGTLLTTITDFNKSEFEDSYNIGDGTAWFYKIKLIDVHGKENVSETIIGNSHP